MSKENLSPIILSLDPGKFNFAYSFLNLDGSVIRTGMLSSSMVDLKQSETVTKDVKEFKKEVKMLCSGRRLFVVFERFVPRGRYMGNLVEITCMKIGIMLSSIIEENDVKIIPILASSWKNFFKKNNLGIINDSAPEHILDAISIGFYFLMHFKHVGTKRIRRCTKNLANVNFQWYKYKNQWFYGKRIKPHLKGRRNSFGN